MQKTEYSQNKCKWSTWRILRSIQRGFVAAQACIFTVIFRQILTQTDKQNRFINI